MTQASFPHTRAAWARLKAAWAGLRNEIRRSKALGDVDRFRRRHPTAKPMTLEFVYRLALRRRGVEQ